MNHRKSNQFINNEKVTGSNSGWGDCPKKSRQPLLLNNKTKLVIT